MSQPTKDNGFEPLEPLNPTQELLNQISPNGVNVDEKEKRYLDVLVRFDPDTQSVGLVFCGNDDATDKAKIRTWGMVMAILRMGEDLAKSQDAMQRSLQTAAMMQQAQQQQMADMQVRRELAKKKILH